MSHLATAPSAAAETSNGGRSRWLALIGLSLSLLVIGLDSTILMTALPTMSTALKASTSQLQWFTDSYNLAMAALLLPAGLLGDRFGRKKMMIGALALFGAGSLWSAFATSSAMLIAARALLGAGAAFLMPLAMSVLLVLFEPGERQRAVSLMMTANMIGFPLGPIVGGVLLDNFWWGSVFLINVPVIAVALVAVTVLVPESRNPESPRIDLRGVAFSTLGMVGVTYGIIEAGERGWGSALALAPLAVGVGLLVAFVVVERGARQPLVDLALFRSRGFTGGALLAALVSFTMFGVLFNTPQYFQAVLGSNALGTGLRLLPMVGGLMVGVQIANRMVDRIGAKAPIAIGFGLLAAALLIGATTSTSDGYGFAAVWLVILGAGMGFALPTTTMAALGALSKERSGVGSALVQALRQLASTIGVAILGTLASTGYRNGLDLRGLPDSAADAVRSSVTSGVAVADRLDSGALLSQVRRAFVDGMDATLWACGGIALVGLALALVILPRVARRSAPEAAIEERVPAGV
jgi:EmrB/QacA subfamily drug resistance transporter